MDQLKVFLKQCVKNRFWISMGIALLLPVIAYFVGSGAIIKAAADQEGAIKSAKTEIEKYTGSNPINKQYEPVVLEKKAILDKDVDATWRELFAAQEPLLRWPEVVENEFRSWGRKWPENVDRGKVQQTIIDYVIAYPDFVTKVYKTCNPWNPEDGTGIVAAPDEKMLIAPAGFTQDAPPDLGKVWAEQERLWVLTALLDVVAKVNAEAGAKDWDGAIIKQINSIEVGTMSAQDQVSLAKAVELVEAPSLSPDGEAAPAEEEAGGSDPASSAMSMMRMMMGGMGGAVGKAETVYSLPVEEGQQFKILPIKMTVLVDQARLPEFLVGLENSPMAIQVLEPEISKPLAAVVKPVYGEQMNYGMMGMGGMMGMMGMGNMMSREGGMPGMAQMMGSMMAGRGGMPGMGGMGRGNEMMAGMMGMYGMNGGQAAAAKKGTDVRSVNKQQARKDKEKKEAEKAKAAPKVKPDLYYNIIEVTVYGQARFYNAPPPPTPEEPSTSESTPEEASAETPKAEEPKTDAATTPPAESPKAEEPKAEEPKADTPAAPKADGPAAKS